MSDFLLDVRRHVMGGIRWIPISEDQELMRTQNEHCLAIIVDFRETVPLICGVYGTVGISDLMYYESVIRSNPPREGVFGVYLIKYGRELVIPELGWIGVQE